MALSGGAWLYAKTQKRVMPSMLKDLVRLNPKEVLLWTGSHWQPVRSWLAVHPPADRKQVSQRYRAARYRHRGRVPLATYDIHLRTGERIGCLGGTTFPTLRGCLPAREIVVGDVLPTSGLPSPPDCVVPPHLPDDIVGWFIGLYIAEGSRSDDTIQIASHIKEDDRFQRLQAVAAAFHSTCAVHETGRSSATANLNGPILNAIIETYVSGRTAKGKHLNVRCWERSNGFLRALLNGYLSGDGHYDDTNDRWRIGFALNDAWVADLRAVCGRLGVSLRLTHAVHQLDDRRFPGYRGQIRFQKSTHYNAKQDTEVIDVQQNRARKYWRVTLEGERQRFALASGVLCEAGGQGFEEHRA